MDQRHQKIFCEQVWNSKEVINPFFGDTNYSKKQILEIGCAEGGGLHYFAKNGGKCYGIEYSLIHYKNALQQGDSLGIKIIYGDILNPDTYKN